VRAEGNDRVERAVIARVDDAFRVVAGSEQELEVDLVCLAVGLSPAVELCSVATCRLVHIPELGGLVPIHDENMESTVPGIYVAGDVAGIEEASSAMEEGRLAGISAAQSLGLVAEEKASHARRARRAVLEAVRQGPFGEVLARKKRQLIAMAHEEASKRGVAGDM
jgi:heterodisulfide reductase subunit A-like polyferredoxin